MRLSSFTIIFALLLASILSSAQQIKAKTYHYFQNELSVISENDNYTLQRRDGYYTNGLYLRFSHAIETHQTKWFNKPSIQKVINEWQIGQAIYNPISYSRSQPEVQDRPFSGYLFLAFGQNIFYRNSSVLQWSASLGTIGPNAYGKQVQRWYHGAIGIYDVQGWDYQLKNEYNLNIKTTYSKTLLQQASEKSIYRLDGFATAQLGNAFTGAGIGAIFKLGQTENNYNSAHWQSRISTQNGPQPSLPYELYFFYEPAITYQAYNAVLEGGLFIKDKGPKTADIKPLFFSQQIGMRYAQNRFTLGLVYTNRTKQAVTQIRNENFCAIQLSYRFQKQ